MLLPYFKFNNKKNIVPYPCLGGLLPGVVVEHGPLGFIISMYVLLLGK